MSILVKATAAEKPRTNAEFIIGLVAAGMLTIIAVAQLITFEDYPTVLAGQPLIKNLSEGLLVATFIVTTEVFAVPYLLRMRLSPLMRLASYFAGWGISVLWFVIAVQLFTTAGEAIDTGVLGATLPVVQPAVPLGLSLILALSLVLSRPSEFISIFRRR